MEEDKLQWTLAPSTKASTKERTKANTKANTATTKDTKAIDTTKEKAMATTTTPLATKEERAKPAKECPSEE